MARSEDAGASPRAREIVVTARRLFQARGYAGVSVDEIGASLGLTGPSIYRHFAGKAAILQAVVLEAVEVLEDAASRPTRAAVIDALAAAAVGDVPLGSAIDAELRHLPDRPRSELQARIDDASTGITRRLGADDADGGRFRARALVAVAVASSFYDVDAPRHRHEAVIGRALRALADAPTLDGPGLAATAAPELGIRAWLPRDEAVLAALPALFTARGGIGGITMEDLGAAAGLSGPSVYTYFAGKREVVLRAVERTSTWATSSLQQALSFSSDGADVMRRALRDYVELSRRLPVFSTPLELDEATFDAATRDRVAAFVLGYRELWATCARIGRPAEPPAESAVLLWAAHAVVNSARTGPVGELVPTDARLLELALTVFDA